MSAGYLHNAPAATVFMKLLEKEVNKIIKSHPKTHTHTHCIYKLYNLRPRWGGGVSGREIFLIKAKGCFKVGK